jgi:chitodextrinase
VSALTYSDTGLSNTTSYSYRVRARDGAGTMGPYSNIASGAAAAAVISAPASPNAIAAGSSQITVKWQAATETGGTISQYRIERCAGAGCTNYSQVASTAALGFMDSALSALTTYRYRLRAADAAGNVGPYSAVVQATTASSRHWWDFPARPGQWIPFRPIGPLTPLK